MTYLQLKIPPVLLVFIFATLMWLVSNTLNEFSIIISYNNLLAVLFLMLGLIVTSLGLYAFNKAHTTVDPRSPQKSSSLVTTGIYRVTRNPMYLGFLCFLISAAVYLTNLLTFVFIPCFIFYMNAFQIKPEEKLLEQLFGDPYVSYCCSVRRWL